MLAKDLGILSRHTHTQLEPQSGLSLFSTYFLIARQLTTLHADIIIPSQNPLPACLCPLLRGWCPQPVKTLCITLALVHPSPPYPLHPQRVLLILPPMSPIPPPLSFSTDTILAQPLALPHTQGICLISPGLSSLPSVHIAAGVVTTSTTRITVSHRAFAYAVPSPSAWFFFLFSPG